MTATETTTGSAASRPTTPAKDIDSHDILDRKETSDEVTVKHVLISWKELAPIYRGQQDARASGLRDDGP